MINSPNKWDGGFVWDRLFKHTPVDEFKALELIEQGVPPRQAMREARQPSFIDELEERGYDPKTIYFHIDGKKLSQPP